MSQETKHRIRETTDTEGRKCYYIQHTEHGIWIEDNDPAVLYYSKKLVREAVKVRGYKLEEGD